ncbi:outer membrane protein assembly factor BamE [Pelagibacteraceae bacterium]|nr:outer membrane protein assembly factor BamE [Pelagibacteraceae bacterium]
MHIKKIISLLVFLFIFIGCAKKDVIRTHGISYLEKREKLIIVEKSNKNDAINILGQPATKGMTDNNLWIYIERSTTRGKLTKLGKDYLKKNNVLVLEFNKFGILIKKDFFDKDDMKDVKFAKTVTENKIKKENFIYSFLSSIRQKMQIKRK